MQGTESTPANGTDFAISVYFVGGATLQAASHTLVPRLNERVDLAASVSLNGQPLQITRAQAVIRNPNGGTETLDFPTGQNTSVAWTPREPGTHAVDIIVTALGPDGSSIERTDFLAIEVQPSLSKAQVSLNLALLLCSGWCSCRCSPVNLLGRLGINCPPCLSERPLHCGPLKVTLCGASRTGRASAG